MGDVYAEFEADFSHFVIGAKEADAALAQLEGRGDAIGGKWESAFKSINLQALFTSPATEAVKIAGNFATALGPVGIAGLAAGAGLAVAGRAAWDLATASADTATQLGDLSDTTEMSVPELSRLADVAVIAGSDIASLSRVVLEMQKRMAEHPTAFADGLKRINVEARDFESMSWTDKLIALGKGFQAQVDLFQKVAAGTAILGRNYREMVPVLGDLASAQEKLSASDPWTQADVDNAKEFKQESASLSVEFGHLSDEVGRLVTGPLAQLLKWRREAQFGGLSQDVRDASDSFAWLGAAWTTLRGNAPTPEVNDLDKHTAALTTSTQAAALAVPTLILPAAERVAPF